MNDFTFLKAAIKDNDNELVIRPYFGGNVLAIKLKEDRENEWRDDYRETWQVWFKVGLMQKKHLFPVYGEEEDNELYFPCENGHKSTKLFSFNQDVYVRTFFGNAPMGSKFSCLNPTYKYIKIPEFASETYNAVGGETDTGNYTKMSLSKFKDDDVIFVY